MEELFLNLTAVLLMFSVEPPTKTAGSSIHCRPLPAFTAWLEAKGACLVSQVQTAES